MSLPQVSIEKRLLPLLDITLILVGILIVVMGTPSLGQDRVFIVPIIHGQLTYENMVIHDGEQMDLPNAARMLRIASSNGFSNVVIQTEDNSPMGYDKTIEVEGQLQTIALKLAQEEDWPESLTVRAQ